MFTCRQQFVKLYEKYRFMFRSWLTYQIIKSNLPNIAKSSTSIMWKIASRNNVLLLTQPIFQDKNLLLTFPFQIRTKFTFKMTLFQWIFYSLICLISAKKKPNILVILADDLGKNFILIFGQIQTWIFLQVTMTFLGITQIWSHRTCKN